MELKIGVIGAGSWGTTLAILLAQKGYRVTLWVYEADQLEIMRQKRENIKYLPGISLPDNLVLSGNLSETVSKAEYLVLAVPTHAMRTVCEQIQSLVHPEQIVVNVSKGIENVTLKRMSEVIRETLNLPVGNIVSLYGPSHAEEVSRGIATAVVAACPDLNTARKVRELFFTDYFRVYSHDDIVGVECGGSLKNVIAIAAGICDGAGFGDNTKAALLTRGLVEMARLGTRMGARRETFSGLSGMGDLIVTCMSKHSRNRYVGEQIGKGKTLEQVLSEMVMVAEGVKTTQSVHELALQYQVEMP
ncbi:MAG: NAD(P)-dependent glycerol-3-phosphate dehydrogenase, partial [Methanobacteriota archaeon]